MSMNKLTLQASGAKLTIESKEDVIVITVGERLITQALHKWDLKLLHFVKIDELGNEHFSMSTPNVNYSLSFFNIKRVSEFLNIPIEQIA